MKFRAFDVALMVFSLISILLTATPAEAVVVTEFALPRTSALPENVAINTKVGYSASTGIFVTESSLTFGNRIARLGTFPSFGTWTEWPSVITGLSASSQPWGIAVNPDGALVAFTEFQGNRIGILNIQTGGLNEIPLPIQGSGPRNVVWINNTAFAFTEFADSRIGIFNIFGTPGGGNVLTEKPTLAEWWFPGSYPNDAPWGIAFDGSAHVWWAGFGGNSISRMNLLSKRITQYVIPQAGSGPTDIAIDANGNVWFTAQLTNKIYRFNPSSNVFTQYSGLTANAAPYGIAIDVLGKVWFTESGANQIGVLNPSTGILREIPLPTANSAPHGIAAAVTTTGTNVIAFAESGVSNVGTVLESGTAGPATVTITTNFVSQAVTSSLTSSITTTSPTMSNVQTATFFNAPAGQVTVSASTSLSASTTLASTTSGATSSGTSFTDTVQFLETSTSAIVTSFIATTSGVLTTTFTSTSFTTSATTTTTATATTTSTSVTTSPVTSTGLTFTTQFVPVTSVTTGTAIIPAPTPIPGFPAWAIVLGFVVATIGLVARRRRLHRRG